jgi:hypothetical protein
MDDQPKTCGTCRFQGPRFLLSCLFPFKSYREWLDADPNDHSREIVRMLLPLFPPQNTSACEHYEDCTVKPGTS